MSGPQPGCVESLPPGFQIEAIWTRCARCGRSVAVDEPNAAGDDEHQSERELTQGVLHRRLRMCVIEIRTFLRGVMPW